jgi:hypothetical protein
MEVDVVDNSVVMCECALSVNDLGIVPVVIDVPVVKVNSDSPTAQPITYQSFTVSSSLAVANCPCLFGFHLRPNPSFV